MRLIDADALKKRMVNEPVKAVQDVDFQAEWFTRIADTVCHMIDMVDEAPTVAAPRWHRVEEPPKEKGEYIVAYHPCWWNDVKTSVTEIGIDTFRGKTSWAKRKFQRVTHWMQLPEPPKEDA